MGEKINTHTKESLMDTNEMLFLIVLLKRKIKRLENVIKVYEMKQGKEI